MMQVGWRSLTSEAEERLALSTGLDHRATSTITTADGPVRYEITTGPDWRTRTLEIESASVGRLHLSTDGQGGWMLNGRPHPELTEAVDVDFVLSPFTMTLPIRRLDLAVGRSADIVVARVGGDLTVNATTLRFTRTAHRRYRVDSPDDRNAEFDVDDTGLVLDYPGGWARL